MTKFLISMILVLLAFFGVSQGIGVEKAKPCYEKGGNNSGKYRTWECGNKPGVVDCNAELQLDEGSGIVVKRATDNMNLAGVGKPFTGTCEMCHQNGKLQRTVTFVEGRENGRDTSKYESGCDQVIREHINGVETGQWIYFYDSTAQVAWEENYLLGEKHGKQLYLKPNGDTTKLEFYQNGLLHGTRKSYYRGSKIHKEANYKNGLLDGKFITYNLEGVIIEEINYKEGKKNDVCKYYFDDGVLLSTGKYYMDLKDGEFKMFYYDGKLQSLESYKRGIKEGKFEEYYPDQKPKRLAVYRKDVLIEEHKYDEQGNETYSFGAPTKSKNEDDQLPGDKKKKGK